MKRKRNRNPGKKVNKSERKREELKRHKVATVTVLSFKRQKLLLDCFVAHVMENVMKCRVLVGSP
jgi:hypothetical protein